MRGRIGRGIIGGLMGLALAPVALVSGVVAAAEGAGAAPAATPSPQPNVPAATPRAAVRDTAARELTLDEVLAIARKRNRGLIADRAHLLQAQTSLDAAWAVLLPTVAAQGRYTRNYAEFKFGSPGGPQLLIQPVNQLDGSISFTAPLLVPAAWWGLKSVKSGIAAAEANYDVSDTAVMYAVAQAFYAAAISDEVLAARRSNIDVARATLTNAKTRFQAGTVTKVDVDRAELALVRAEQLERDASHGRNQSYRTLGTLAQIEGTFRAVPPERLPPPPQEQDLPSVLKVRPEFRALQLQSAASDLHADALGWRWAPSLSGFGNARKFNYDNFNFNRYSWAVGLQLDWVLFDGGTRDAERHKYRAEAEEVRARADVLQDNIRDDLANSRSLLSTKREAVFAALRAIELAKETIDLVRTQYEAGTVTQVDLLQAQDGLVGSELALAQARFDVAVADLTLRRASGTFPPK